MSLWFYCVAPVIGFIGMMSGGYWGVGCGWLVVPAIMLILREYRRILPKSRRNWNGHRENYSSWLQMDRHLQLETR